MHLRISFFDQPSDPATLVHPGCIFDTLKEARQHAFEIADDPLVGPVDSILIGSIDGGTVNERWVRDGDQWVIDA